MRAVFDSGGIQETLFLSVFRHYIFARIKCDAHGYMGINDVRDIAIRSTYFLKRSNFYHWYVSLVLMSHTVNTLLNTAYSAIKELARMTLDNTGKILKTSIIRILVEIINERFKTVFSRQTTRNLGEKVTFGKICITRRIKSQCNFSYCDVAHNLGIYKKTQFVETISSHCESVEFERYFVGIFYNVRLRTDAVTTQSPPLLGRARMHARFRSRSESGVLRASANSSCSIYGIDRSGGRTDRPTDRPTDETAL